MTETGTSMGLEKRTMPSGYPERDHGQRQEDKRHPHHLDAKCRGNGGDTGVGEPIWEIKHHEAQRTQVRSVIGAEGE